jgi:hypothetical protein
MLRPGQAPDICEPNPKPHKENTMIDKIVGFDAKGEKVLTHVTISELYPEIGKITLFVAFEEADSESEPNYQQIIFTADSDAAFRLGCTREKCLVGGFDFAPIVDEAVKNRESRLQGTLECQGTLGPLGPRCSLKAEYRIMVELQAGG